MASTKVAGSNGARSSGPSPRPTSLTGTPSSRWTATTIPPLAVPSSLVSTIPVISTASANTLAWRRPFCPVVASSTSRTSSTVACRSMTRLILPSSSIRPVLVCSRPAVSTMTVSVRSSMPCRTASNATLAGSASSRSERTTGAPTRCPQVSSWSAAAARKVSAAPSRTVWPSPMSARASLPQVDVLPVPLTPTMSTTAGRSPCLATCNDLSMSGPTCSIRSCLSRPRTSAVPRAPPTRTWVRSSLTICAAGAAPRSAPTRVSSISSQPCSSSPSRESRLSSTEPNPVWERASRPRSRVIRPASGCGASATSVAGAPVSGGVSTPGWPVPSPSPRAGPGGGVAAGGASGTSGARGRCRERSSMTPPAIRARATRTMTMIKYSITAPVWQMDRRSGPLPLPQPLAHHRGHPVALHGGPVEGVRDLHRPLLVRDDDQLRTAAQLLEDLEQPLQVGVVQRRLDLVQHVERRRAGLEDGQEEGDRGQRALAAGQQRQPLDLLARRPGFDVDARGEHVVGLGQHQPALAAGEQPREDLLELGRGVGEGRREHLLDPVIDLFDHGEQVPPGLLEVLELVGQERVALLEGRVLLQGQRVDLAELVKLALRGGGPLLLLGPGVGDRPHGRRGLRRIMAVRPGQEVRIVRRPATAAGRRSRPPAVGGGRVRLVQHRHRHVGPVLGDESVGVHAELLGGPRHDLLQPHPLLGPGDLRTVRGVDHPVQVTGEGPDPRPDLLERLGTALARLLGRLAVGLGGGQRFRDPGQGRIRPHGHGPGNFCLLRALPARGRRGLGRPALAHRGRGEGVGPARDRPQPLLGGPDLQPGIGLGLPRGTGR